LSALNNSPEKLEERKRELRIKYKDNYGVYSHACLHIRTKAGNILPFRFNSAQKYIHEKVEEQRAKTGMVRAIVLKGRQQGCSTYIQGRFYWRTSFAKGLKAFILTHESEATDNLFEMTQRYHDNCHEWFKPVTGAASAHELVFAELDSGYKVGTAGNKSVGRSATIQLFHGSEVAYWPNAEGHAAGILQAVPEVAGTEVWLESTANGVGDFFHKQWQMATRGESSLIPIFIPWFWQTEYQKEVDDNFLPSPEERELAKRFGLSNEQLAWRRGKIVELGGGDMGLQRFKSEYPCTAEEAFEESDAKKLIPSKIIRAAVGRQVKPLKQWKPLWGLDIGGEKDTGDRTALCKRQANVLLEPPKSWRGKNPMQIAGLIKHEYDETPTDLKPAFVCVDLLFEGRGIVARLREMGVPVIGVNVAESESASEGCMRMRDELWWKSKKWFDEKDVVFPAEPSQEMELLITELASPMYEHTSSGKLVVESKEDMADRGIASPDLADAFNLTFAGPNIEQEIKVMDRYATGSGRSNGSWMTA
jgi:hypothetical protein